MWFIERERDSGRKRRSEMDQEEGARETEWREERSRDPEVRFESSKETCLPLFSLHVSKLSVTPLPKEACKYMITDSYAA